MTQLVYSRERRQTAKGVGKRGTGNQGRKTTPTRSWGLHRGEGHRAHLDLLQLGVEDQLFLSSHQLADSDGALAPFYDISELSLEDDIIHPEARDVLCLWGEYSQLSDRDLGDCSSSIYLIVLIQFKGVSKNGTH